MPTTSKNAPERPYKHLTLNFIKGKIGGQLKSLHRTKETRPEKIADFKAALAYKDIRIHSHQLTPQLLTPPQDLGIELKG